MTATTSAPRRPLETFHRVRRGSNGHHDSSEVDFRIPFHGSCSRCHHFHINHSFTFSLDSTVHTRLFCERCNHPIFGLGRVSTQSTLASVESGSTFTPRACVDRPGLQPVPHAEAVPGTPGLGLLTTITERRSPATSRSTSHIYTPAPTLEASLAGEEPMESRALPEDTAQGDPEEQVLHPQTATLRRLRTIAHRFKERFGSKSGEWKLSRMGLHITKRIKSPHDAPELSTAPFAGHFLSDTHRTDVTGDVSASISTTEMPSSQRQSNNAEELVNRTGEDAEDRHASLRARRRETTLAREREAASIRECECSPECFCKSGSHVVQVDRTGTPENIHVPDYLFPHRHSSTGSSNSQPSQNGAQGLDLLHIGGHFDSSRRSSSADESNSAAEGGTRRIRLSQGSTLWSDGSSVSLRARRPPFGRASSMPVGTRSQYLAGVRSGSHTNDSIPGSGWPETARAPSSIDEGSLPGRTSHTESSRNGEVPSHESSASLANLPGPQEEEQLVDGVNPGNHPSMRDGNEVTPRLHSSIRLDGDLDGALPVGSDGLSSALQDLVNREIADHDVHLAELLANHRSG